MSESRRVTESEGGPERESGISKLVGFTPEQEEEIFEQFKSNFDNQPRPGALFELDGVVNAEREKTPKETEIVGNILQRMPDFIKRYGGTSVPLGQEHIHFVDKEKLDTEARAEIEESGHEAVYLNIAQGIGIFGSGDSLRDAQGIVHEVLHFNSFNSLDPDKTGKFTTRVRRSGFGVKDRDNAVVYFEDINEEVIEELTKRFDKEHFDSIPVLADEVEERRKLVAVFLRNNPTDKELADDIAFAKVREPESEGGKPTIEGGTYHGRESVLSGLINDIYKKNKGTFASTEDVFSIFAEATMSGRLLKVAKIIEETYGKGSFRRLGEKTGRRRHQ